MKLAFAGLSLLGLASLAGSVPQNVLCVFEVFEGQPPMGKTLQGSPVRCASKKITDYNAMRKLLKEIADAGLRGEQDVVCRFPVYGRYKNYAIGLARNCQRV